MQTAVRALRFFLLRNNLCKGVAIISQHEALDGSGYPRVIQGGAFHDYAQICDCAICTITSST